MRTSTNEDEPKTLERLRLNTIIFLLLWCCSVALAFFGASFWSVVLIGVVGCYFALRDWRTVRALARANMAPEHHHADVQALIDGSIEIAEHRRRKESGNAD